MATVSFSIESSNIEVEIFSNNIILLQKTETGDELIEIDFHQWDELKQKIDLSVSEHRGYLKFETATNENIKSGRMLWDSELENIGLPSNMNFGFGSEFGDIIYRLQKTDDIFRWCVFKVDQTWYVIKQQNINNTWLEDWTIQMDSDCLKARQYAEEDALKNL